MADGSSATLGGAPPQRHPTFIGIGAQKAATTWLHAVLAGHPEAYVVPGKEVDFFSCHYLRGYAWYRRQFAAAGAARASGELSPSYLPSAEAPERAHRFAPDLKILVSLRDPLERAFSNHVHEIRKGLYALADTSFEAGLADNPMYLEQSRYARHLRRWLDWFPRERVIVLFQEEIAAAPAAQARALFTALGIDPSLRPATIAERVHENVAYRSQGVKAALRQLGRGARRLGLGPLVTTAKRLPGPGTLYRANREDLRASVPPMAETTRRRLLELLAADMAELARLLGRPSLPWPSWEAAGLGAAVHADA